VDRRSAWNCTSRPSPSPAQRVIVFQRFRRAVPDASHQKTVGPSCRLTASTRSQASGDSS
jgi:hypothetical protein